MAVQVTDSPTLGSLDHPGLAAWLRLAYTPGLGRLAAYQLLNHFETPLQVLNAVRHRLADGVVPPASSGDGARHRLQPFAPDVDGAPLAISHEAASLLAGPLPARLAELADATLRWQDAAPDNYLIALDDPRYPAMLRHIPDPPLLLYVKGNPALLQQEAVAVVGSRSASLQGKLNASHFARTLSQQGQTIVSGLALGIDAAAHEGGMGGPGGTVAVIGTGIDRIYPRRNASLTHRIAAEGCIASEFPLGTPARPEHFPIRNRIIAGLARATLVIEAAAHSGSLITAHLAVRNGRDVYVLPGSVHSALAQGCHFLIREGARLVATVEDLLEDLGLRKPEVRPAAITAAAGLLLETLSFDPIPADELAARLQLDPAETQASLLALELAGVVERLPGGSFQRLKP